MSIISIVNNQEANNQAKKEDKAANFINRNPLQFKSLVLLHLNIIPIPSRLLTPIHHLLSMTM